jgi:dTDP-4-amino-4,6-dideoxygalactose transaminase
VSHVPLVDLSLQHRQIAHDVEQGFARVLADTSFILGKDVQAFEEQFARFCGADHCIGVANGTDALELALRAAGVGIGDEVIVPANTFIATALAVSRIGATPVFVDCDADHHLIDVSQIEARLSPRTRAILPVHLYGQMAPLERIEPIARKHGLAIIEDAAQAQGAKRGGRPAGSAALAAGTSFYPGKNLGAYGDAGAVLTSDAALADRVRALRNYGSPRRYHHPECGFNSRMDTLQAVVLNAKLRHLDAWNQQRREAAARYEELLRPLDWVGRPRTLAGNEHVWHLYVVRVPDRDAVLERLQAAGIGAAIHYPSPIHLTGAFAHLGLGAGSFPVAERLAGQILSLPIFPGIVASQQERVVEILSHARP